MDDSNKYFSFYNIEHEHYSTFTAYIDYPGESGLWSWVISPNNPKGSVLYIHGYLDHSALSSDLINFLLDQGYEIYTFDLPGHGRSFGSRGGLDNFSTYRQALIEVMSYWDIKDEETLFIGHSTGCAVMLDYFINGGDSLAALWAAPMVRFHRWELVKNTLSLFSWKNLRLPVRRAPSCSNPEFYRKKWSDPLNISVFELSWPISIIQWNENLPGTGEITMDLDIYIMQGNKDNVVQHQYNIPYLQSLFSEVQLYEYPNLDHHLFNEQDGEEVYRNLDEILMQYSR